MAEQDQQLCSCLGGQRIELLRWTRFGTALQLAFADHVHELDPGEGDGTAVIAGAPRPNRRRT